MCECMMNGYTTDIGINTFGCYFVPNKNCAKCVEIAKARYDAFMDSIESKNKR